MNNSRTCITISKVGKALSKISFVFSIVLFVCCVSCYFIFLRVYDFEIWSHGICMTVSEYFYNLSNNTMTFHTLIANMAMYSLIALVEIIVSRLCYNYFTYLYEVNDFYTKTGI